MKRVREVTIDEGKSKNLVLFLSYLLIHLAFDDCQSSSFGILGSWS